MATHKKQRIIVSLIVIAIVLLLINNHSGRKDYAYGSNVVLRLSFDDSENAYQDYSGLDSTINVYGSTSIAGRDKCLWDNCLDLTENTRSQSTKDYLEIMTTNWDDIDSMAISFWFSPLITSVDGSNSQGYMSIINNDGDKWYETLYQHNIQDGGYGISPNWQTTTSSATMSQASGTKRTVGEWYHCFVQYDASTGKMQMYINGNFYKETSTSASPLRYTDNGKAKIWLGRLQNIDFSGYMDEVVIWNTAGFDQAFVRGIYDTYKLRTPPNKDLYVKDIKYELPYQWELDNNPLRMSGSMPINITIANAGSQASGAFTYEVVIEGHNYCSGIMTLNATSERIVACNWPVSEGFHKGNVVIDAANIVAEDVEINNIQRIYIPYMDRPWFHFSLEEWENDLKPYCQANPSTPAGVTCSWLSHFGCSEFSTSYTGNSVDPYGKKFRECAMGCMYNDYTNPSGKDMCGNAYDHLFGWAAIPASSYNNVQATHELAHVGIGLDIMFPDMTKEEWESVTGKYHDICQAVTNMPNVRPDKDPENTMDGGNGWGFGDGMAAFCYSLIGAYKENPTMIQKLDNQYWGKNLVDEWMDREEAYLRSYQNDPNSQYQEGFGYKWYAEPHILESLWFRKKYGLFENIEDYNNAFCAMAQETLTTYLDYNYDGQTLRNDNSFNFRGISRGDSQSYLNPSGGMFQGASVLTYEGLLCDDQDIKGSLLWLRKKMQDIGDATSSYADAYLYKLLANQANMKNPDNVMPRFIYDNANDIFTMRGGYTYTNDFLLEVDGGNEEGGGHSQASGYFLYIFGEPFFDYPQVPYEDDVRSEVWKNAVSFQDTAVTTEGTAGTYSQTCGNAPLNQYYGMSSCTKPVYPQDYPNYRIFPLQYGGDLEDYLGTSDAEFGGVYAWRPYKNSDGVYEYFVKFGDIVVKRTVAKNVGTGTVYNNFININDEYTETRNGLKFTLVRTGTEKTVETDVTWANSPTILGGGDSGVQYCFGKTSCASNYRGLGTYRRLYYQTATNNLDMIYYHHWYMGTKTSSIENVGTTDKGVRIDTRYIIFDTNNDGITSYNGYETDGWALAYDAHNQKYGAFNATYLSKDGVDVAEASDEVSFFVDNNYIEYNTMSREGALDYEHPEITAVVGSLPATPLCNPITETCNNQDDDCNGLIDEDLLRTCEDNNNLGVQNCSEGSWGTCRITTINTYSCINGDCVLDVNGVYDTNSFCDSQCSTTNTTNKQDPYKDYYACSKNGACVINSNGQYLTSDCNDKCVPTGSKINIQPLLGLALVGVIAYILINKTKKRRKR